MINSFLYDDNFYRTIPACIIDGRAGNPAVSGQTGFVIKEFYDDEVSKARKPGVIPYKMETVNGNLIGFMSLKTENGSASLYQLWLRQAYKTSSDIINQEISIFITSRNWVFDILL